jgi:hypothetical protein
MQQQGNFIFFCSEVDLFLVVHNSGNEPAHNYHQIFDALENLNKLVDQVFGRIDDRLKEEKSRLNSLHNRIGVVQVDPFQ